MLGTFLWEAGGSKDPASSVSPPLLGELNETLCSQL